MRRMYSEQELTNVIKKVFEEELESGALDDKINQATADYIQEQGLNPEDLNFSSVDFVAKTISQSNYNWSIDVPDITIGDLTLTKIFAKLIVINKVMYLVYEVDLANETAEDIVINSSYYSANITIPAEIGQYIYDHLGKKVSETGAGSIVDTELRDGKYGVVASSGVFTLQLQHYGQNIVRVGLGGFGSSPVTIESGASNALHGRTFIVL